MSERSHTPKGKLARERILRAAEPLIAAHGFHGTSIRDVAEAAELPLATVVYHFARKERLHGAVLGEIAAQLMAELTASPGLDGAVGALVRWSLDNPGRVRLLMRELLDNPSRVARASSLPLAPPLMLLVDGARAAGHPEPELAILHIVGAVSYVVAARPTVRRIVGVARDRQMMESYEEIATAFAKDVLGARRKRKPSQARQKEEHDGPRAGDRARSSRPRARLGADDGRRGRGRDAPGDGLRG